MSHSSSQTEPVTASELPPVRLKLQVLSGPDFGREFALEKGTYRLGQHPENDFALTDPAVSRAHLVVEVLPDAARLTDLGSTNGASCDGVRFRDLEARPGAVIRVGRTELRLVPVLEPAPLLPPADRGAFGDLVGASLKMRELFAVLARLAPTESSVLIEGETGSGKELCARAIHARSRRARGPFVVCDLRAASRELFESELFGHVRGAFTGATHDRAGLLEQARGGTVFLDEVGEIPGEQQAKLLSVLERRESRRLGGEAPTPLDVRVLASTRQNLEAQVRQGRFREDLFHRLAVLHVRLPPLRERKEDIPLLVDALLAELGSEPSRLSPSTRALLSEYPWPGNVRELRNLVERVQHLGEVAVGQQLAQVAAAPSRAGRGEDPVAGYKEARERVLAAFERDYLLRLLERCDFNVSGAARASGIHRVQLHRMLRRHAIKVHRDGRAPEEAPDA